MQTCTWYLTLLGARRFPRCPGNLVREPARNRKPGEKDGSGCSQTSAPRHRPSGRQGRARAGGSSRGAANSPPAPPPGALPSKPLLPAPLQTAGPRRPGVTEAAAGRLRRPVASARGWGVGSAGFQSAFPPPSELGTPPPPPPPLRGARPERILRGCVTAGGASSSSCSAESQQASAGGRGVGAGTPRRAVSRFRTPRLRAVRAAAALGCGVRPRLGGSPRPGSGRERWWGRRRWCTGSSSSSAPGGGSRGNWAPPEVAPPLVWARAGWGRREPSGTSRARQRARAWTCPGTAASSARSTAPRRR